MLYIMRHGKTDWNLLHRLQGHSDIPLNEEGRKMAQDAREKYKEIHFDVCYCSPLVRAVETAEIFLSGTNTPVIPDERLKEMGFGVYEGIGQSELAPDCPIHVLFEKPECYCVVEGGESFETLYERTGDFLKKVAMPLLAEGKNVLIVGHGAMNCSLISRIRGTDLAHFWDGMMGNCEVAEMETNHFLKPDCI